MGCPASGVRQRDSEGEHMMPNSVKMALISIAISVNALALIDILSYEWSVDSIVAFCVGLCGSASAGAAFFIWGDEHDKEKKDGS